MLSNNLYLMGFEGHKGISSSFFPYFESKNSGSMSGSAPVDKL